MFCSQRLLSVIVSLLCTFCVVTALFEDQAFKFDWRKTLIGRPDKVQFFETASGESSILAASNLKSEKNGEAGSVLAVLDADSGEIRWRHPLEEGEVILDAMIASQDNTLVTISKKEKGFESQTLISARIWNPESGSLIYELPTFHDEEVSESSFIYDKEINVVFIEKSTGRIKVKIHELKPDSSTTGDDTVRTASFSTGSKTENGVSCITSKGAFVCLSQDLRMIYSAKLPLLSKSAFSAMSLNQLGLPEEAIIEQLTPVYGSDAFIQLKIQMLDGRRDVLLLKTDAEGKITGSRHLTDKIRSVTAVSGCVNTDDVIVAKQKCADDKCHSFDKTVVVTMMRRLEKVVHNTEFSFDAISVDSLSDIWATCEDDEKASGSPIYQVLALSLDGILVSVTPLGNVMWQREESLSEIVKAELISPELKDDDGTYDTEATGHISNEAKDIMDMFVRRIKHHLSLLNKLLVPLIEQKSLKQMLTGDSDANYDDFGLRKIIVTLTASGKVLGLDSISGKLIWRFVFPSDLSKETFFFLQRGSTHFAQDARSVLVYWSRYSGQPEVLSFNPLTGEIVSIEQVPKDVTKPLLLQQTDEHHLKPLLLLTEGHEKVYLYPQSSFAALAEISENKIFVVAMDHSNTVNGYLLKKKNQVLSLQPIWSLANPNTNKVTVIPKSPEDVVHSQGRVLADRSVLFKYVNPNLAFVLAESQDSAKKNHISVYLVDLVTGLIVFSANHKRVSGPYHVVHSENWAVYTYYNEKARRSEMTSIELFEGKEQSNTTVFSSLTTSVQSPMVERQSYILGSWSTIAAMKDTVTEKGITSKNLIIASSTGSLYNLPRQLVDPRRPNLNTPPEMREPGIPPYIPELQLPHEMILNYNQTIALPRGIVTVPTGLESTSIVFVYGLDIYCTRIAPSKGFDLLKDDFDYSVISTVLLALIAATFATKRLSQRKNLKQAWR